MASKQFEICIECKDNPIWIKKRKLCKSCYRILRSRGALGDTNYRNYSHITVLQKDQQYKREFEFVKNYFTHKNWLYEPVTFNLNGTNYTPDFYDAKRNVFIEVSGTRQAYHANKHKYKMFRKYFPKLNFEIRKSDGSILEGEPYFSGKWHTS